jgi:hypothetical protein
MNSGADLGSVEHALVAPSTSPQNPYEEVHGGSKLQHGD